MRPLFSTLVPFLLGAVFTSPSKAILVAPSSNCGVQCGNVLSSTSGSDLVCGDGGYNTVPGQTFQSCINCEINSKFVDYSSDESDLRWLLYNLRYAVSWCLFGYPNNTNIASTPCITTFACGTLEAAVRYAALAKNASQYDYCSVWRSDMLPKCQTCLAQLGNEFYLSNFITALEAGCEQRPVSGSSLSLGGSLFSKTAVTITTPVNSSAPAYTPPPSGPLSLGAEVGIAVGSVVFIVTLLGCCIIWRGKRRRRAYLAKLASASQHQPTARRPFHDKAENSPESESGRAFMAPDSARWQGWNEDSPQSARGETGGMMSMGIPMGGFSPYHSQYSSPISPGAARWHVGGTDFGAGAGKGKGKDKEAAWEADGSGHGTQDGIEMSQMASGQQMGFSPVTLAMQTQAAPIIKPPVPTHLRESLDSAASRHGNGSGNGNGAGSPIEAEAEAEAEIEAEVEAEVEDEHQADQETKEEAVHGMGVAL